MPAKKKPSKVGKKSAPARKPAKKAAPSKAAKKLPKAVVARSRKERASAAPSGRAARMARFSKQVLREEEAPVAVRTFNEARAGIEQSKKLDVRTGAVVPTVAPKSTPPAAAPVAEPRPAPRAAPAVKAPPRPPQPEPDEDLDAEVEADLATDFTPPPPANKPQQPKVQPLTGELVAPKRANPFEEEFRVGAPAKKGKKGAPPTKEDLGKIELRMQRGTKDATIAHANPDYLQRSFNQAAQKGKVAATSGTKADTEHRPDEFEVAMDKGKKRMDAALTDFGDIEIAQQTRRGSKKVGKLDTDEDEQTS